MASVLGNYADTGSFDNRTSGKSLGGISAGDIGITQKDSLNACLQRIADIAGNLESGTGRLTNLVDRLAGIEPQDPNKEAQNVPAPTHTLFIARQIETALRSIAGRQEYQLSRAESALG